MLGWLSAAVASASCSKRASLDGSLATDALMLTPSAPLPNRQVPHAGDALLHIVTAAEYRRQFMVQPSHVDDVRDTLDKTIGQRTTGFLSGFLGEELAGRWIHERDDVGVMRGPQRVHRHPGQHVGDKRLRTLFDLGQVPLLGQHRDEVNDDGPHVHACISLPVSIQPCTRAAR